MNIEQVPNIKGEALQISIMDVLGTKVRITWTPIIFNKTYLIYYYEKDKEKTTTKKIAFSPPKGTLFYTVGEKSNETLKRGVVYYFYVTYNSAKSNIVSTTILHYPVICGIVKGYKGDNGIDIYSNGACENNREGIICKDYFNKKNESESKDRKKQGNYRYLTMVELANHNNKKSLDTWCLTKVVACAPGKIKNRAIESAWAPAGFVGAEDKHRGHGSWCFVTQELDVPVYYYGKLYKYVWYMHLHWCDKNKIADHQIIEINKEVGKNPSKPEKIGYNMYANITNYKNITEEDNKMDKSAHLHFGIAQDINRANALEYNEACKVLGVKLNDKISR